MAERKPLFLGSIGAEEMAIGDTATFGGLTLSGNIAMGTNKVTGLGAASTSGDALAYGQSSASLAGLALTDDLTMGTKQITGLADGSSSDHGVNKSQLDSAVINGGQMREHLVHVNQLDDAEGILGAGVLTMVANPVGGDTVILTDGSTTRTYGATSGGDVQYTIGGSVAATMQNLATAIAGDGSGIWSGTVFSTNQDAIDADGVVIFVEDDNDATASEVYGVWGTQADCQIVDYTGETQYTKKTTVDLPSSDPVATNFGIRRTQSALVAGEIHAVEDDDYLYGWDIDADVWNQLSGGGSIPDATSASGGATKGKMTADSDYGVTLTTGILRISLAANKGLSFATGDLQTVPNTSAGMDVGASGLEVDLAATNPCLEFSSGDLQLQINGTTLEKTATGARVKGLPLQFEVNSVAVGSTVISVNLDTLTDGSNADALHVHAAAAAAGRLEDELTANENLAKGDPVEWSATNDEIRKVEADVDAQVDAFGVVEESAGITAASSGTVVWGGVAINVLSGATAGARYYANDGGGLVAGFGGLAGGSNIIFIGTAKNATDLMVHPQYIGKKAA